MLIRPATIADLPAINAIYNHYVLHSTATYQTEPSTDAERLSWFQAHGPRHPVLVALEPQMPADASGDRQSIVGWGSLSPFHPRQAFAQTVENSVYVHPDRLRRGLGRALLTALIAEARGLGHHTIVAVISADQTASIALHDSLGFTTTGTLRQVGRKFDRWLDVAYLQLLL